jgi:hypothetical protein
VYRTGNFNVGNPRSLGLSQIVSKPTGQGGLKTGQERSGNHKWRKTGQMGVHCVILDGAMAWLMQSLQVVQVSSPAPSEQGGC